MVVSSDTSNSFVPKTVAEPDASDGARRTRTVGAVQSAISIVRHLGNSGQPEGASQIARAVGMYPGTCYQVLRTLTDDGLLFFDQRSKRYELASNALADLFSGRSKSAHDLTMLRKSHLSALAQTFDATVYLIGCMAGDRGVLVDFAQSESSQIRSVVTTFSTIFQGAMGQISVYIMEPDRSKWRGRYELMPWDNKPDFEVWRSSTESVGHLAYAIDHGHRSAGVTVVTAPICDSLGQLTFFVATLRDEVGTDPEILASIGKRTCACAELIRHEMALSQFEVLSTR